MALWGWVNALPFVLGAETAAGFTHVMRWHAAVNARPAAARTLAWRTRWSFKQEMDDEARRAMFPQNASLAA
jgi:GST-like protein